MEQNQKSGVVFGGMLLCEYLNGDVRDDVLTDEKPDVAYSDIGGMDIQKQEVREAVELPLTHFELYKQIGIDPPRGVLMFGPPGCGKTMLAKAVAHHTTGKHVCNNDNHHRHRLFMPYRSQVLVV